MSFMKEINLSKIWRGESIAQRNQKKWQADKQDDLHNNSKRAG